MENWHLDFPEFLDLRQNSGDPYRRTRTANTAVWICDEFMKRVQNDEPTGTSSTRSRSPTSTSSTARRSPSATPSTSRMAEAGEMHMFKKIGAREQFKSILISLQTTSHPWLTWKDTINNRALNNNTGTIHLSNLCTEISPPAGSRQRRRLQPGVDQPVAHLLTPNGGARLREDRMESRPHWPCASSTTSSTSRGRQRAGG